MNTSSEADLQAADPEPPLPPRVHDFVVRVADRGPSTRALVIMLVGGLLAAVLLLVAMPKPKPGQSVLPTPASEPASTTPDARVPPQVEPVPPVITTRSEPPYKPAPVLPTAAVTDATPTRRERIHAPERVEPPVRVDEQPRVVEVTRSEPPPPAVGATGRAAIDIVAAPQMQPRDREPPIVSSVVARDELTPRPARADRESYRPSPPSGTVLVESAGQ